jgi:hypothetical protein
VFDDALRALDEARALEPESAYRHNLRSKADAGVHATRDHTDAERRAREVKADAWRHAESTSEEPARRAEEEAAEERARLRRVDEQCRIAREEIAGGQYEQAMARLQQLARADGPIPGLAALMDQALAGQAAHEARQQPSRSARRSADDIDPDATRVIKMPYAAATSMPPVAASSDEGRSSRVFDSVAASIGALLLLYLLLRLFGSSAGL